MKAPQEQVPLYKPCKNFFRTSNCHCTFRSEFGQTYERWSHIIFSERHFIQSLPKKNITERNLTESSHSRIVELPKLHNAERHFSESLFSRTLFVRIERYFHELLFSRTSFSRNIICPNVISPNTMWSCEYLPCYFKDHKSYVSITVKITITFWLNSGDRSAQCIVGNMVFG